MQEAYFCRVCLKTKHTRGINLEKKSKYLQLFEYCIGNAINIQYTSQTLCLKCKENVEKFAKFKRQCHKSEQFWQNYIINNEIPNLNDIREAKDPSVTIKEEQIEEVVELKDEYSSPIERLNEDFDDVDGKPSFKIKNISQPLLNNQIKSIDQPLLTNETKTNIRIDCPKVKCDIVNKKTYECKNCKKTYNNYKWLLKHTGQRCCQQKIKIKRNIKINNIELDNVKLSTNDCGLCDLSFSSDLKEHLNEHWNKNELKCKLCDYTGKDFASMISHRYNHCPKLKFRCHLCDIKKLSVLSLQFHFRSAHLNKPGGYCAICDRPYKILKTWKKHHRLHTDSNLFVCDHCGKKFLYRHEIKSHLIDHSNMRQFVCETCGKGFKRISALREHIDLLHTLRVPVKCEHCNKVYKCKNKLNLHLKNVAKDKKFICNVCSKKFYTETVLKKHMFWHTNERPFNCEVCGSKYKAKGQLNVHMRNHTGVMPHKCVDCGKAFATGTQLKRHKSVHTGVRAFKCMQCERSFYMKKGLLEHAAQHKSVESVKLET